MTSLALRRLWRELERLLLEALEIERSRIGPEQAAQVANYIDHNEFGLAHEQLVYALSELGLPPLERSAAILNDTARKMGLQGG